MRTHRLVSLGFVVVLLLSVAVPLRTVEARAIYQGSIQIQAHMCPSGASAVSPECIRTRGPMGVMLSVDGGRSQAMDGAGPVAFDGLVAGEHLVIFRMGPYAERFRQIRALCSNSVAGIYPGPVIIDTRDESRFQVGLAPRSQVTCEVYFIP